MSIMISIMHRSFCPFIPNDFKPCLLQAYGCRYKCTIFRCWQGWTSLSTTGPGEGTLRVLPMLSLASAYIQLRPFFRPKSLPMSLAPDDWELDIDGDYFPGSTGRRTQGLSGMTHPHLRLDKTMISVPQIEPGDQVYCESDVISILSY